MKIGCSGFPTAKAEYYKLFDTVEVQQTFYEPPRIATLKRWRDEAPENFEFTMKAWQLISHEASSPTYKRLKTKLLPAELAECGAFRLTDPVKRAWEKTLESAETLKCKRLLIQNPPGFTPSESHVLNMRRFFSWADAPGKLTIYWEPRGAWPDDLVLELCRELSLVHAVDPSIRTSVTPEHLYYRLHGGKGFRHSYSDEEMTLIVETMQSDDSCVFFNNLQMVENANRFSKIVASRI